MTKITRIEVIDENGRSYVNWEDDNDVSWQFQDDGRTLKVFVNKVKPKTPVEEAYKRVYGKYPVTDVTDGCWENFQAGYKSAQKDYKVGEYQEPEEQKWNAVRESVKWCEEHPDWDLFDYLKPQTPEQVADGLKEAFREAVKQGVVSSTKSPTLYDVIYDWWDRVFGDTDDAETCINNLVDEISLWLPKYQSAEGSQNAYVESAVEGFNDCLDKIRGKLK